ncbi:hypothetical protein F5050DRAFT_1804924 [Lentinula boryana]|uniref:Uncharacterized protein n=1 Tax=Lentinula boryana TaxID=40481 RepID=A0ABQ8QLH3_9AGAR|nr:hypothetical protein F5050DRAFT_1804924 [Lentinula boryana]
MKTSLFYPSSWRRKFPKPFSGEHPKDPQASERSETPTSPFFGRAKPGHEERRERTASGSRPAPHRPPRPPSPNLYGPPIENTARVSALEMESHGTPDHNHRSNRTADLLKAKRSMPELDGVWKGFLEDVNEDHDSLCNGSVPDLPPTQAYSPSVHPRLHGEAGSSGSQSNARRPRATLHTSKSISHIVSLDKSPSSPRSSLSSTESRSCVTDFDSLALFPAPPPLKIRKKIPKPLILLPTATLAPLPPSPSTGSLNPTPVVTPTSPTPPYSPRRMASPPSILKKSQSAALLSPATPGSLTSAYYDSSTVLLARPPRATQSMSNPSSYTSRSISPTTHKSSSSDTMTLPNSRPSRSHANGNRTFSPHLRSDKPLPPLMQFDRRQRNINHPSPVEWGIAV